MLNIVRILSILLLWATLASVSFIDVEVVCAQKSEPAVSLTAEERAWLKAHPDIQLGYVDSHEPQVIVNPDGTYSGIVVDLLDKLNRRLGTAIRLDVYPVKELLDKAKTKEIDGICNLHPEYADRLGMLKTRGYFQHYPTIFARRDVAFKDLGDIPGKTVAIIDKLYFSEKIIKEYEDQITIKKVKSALEGLSSLASGDADIFIGLSHNSYLISKYQMYDIIVKHVYTDDSDRVVMAIRSDWPMLVAIVNKGLSTFSDAELNTIVAKWINLPQIKNVIDLTAEEQAWLAQNHTVRVRVGNFPPYIFLGKDEITGIAIDYLNLIAQRTGVTFEFVHETRPWQEALDSLMNFQGPDLITSLSPIAERKPYMNFSAPYIVSPRMIFTRTDAEFVSGIDELKGRTLAVPKGTLVHKRLEVEYPDIDLMLYDTDIESIEAVSTGKADAYIGNLINASYEILHRGFSNLKIAAPSPFGDDVYTFGIRKDWPELNSIINKALDSIPVEEVAAIRTKYFKLQYEYGINPADVLKWILIVAGSVSGIIFLFIFWNRTLSNKVRERTGALEISKNSLEAEIIERKRAEEELLHLKDQLHKENIYLREEIQLEHNFDEIIGNSEGLRYVLFRVEQIASTDTSVLILGETGTGKELIARAIHNTSPRNERPVIKVNCATLPAHLIESELFGHEKGAFTGATVQRIGRFELADGATLFLDEIGEMPLELQSKLLRVLQDGEFERVGSSRTIKVDVRLITATNRDPETEIQSGRFRQDLFYRLNVYSLTLPPLRERPEDIPLLVDEFIKTFNKKLGKRIELISKKTTDVLNAYSWPGNIRELQNVIERAVIVSQDKTLRVELPEIQTPMPAHEPTKTLDEMERDYIQEVLTLKNWRIDGPEGAAVVLDLKHSTLRSRMQKLGIKRPS